MVTLYIYMILLGLAGFFLYRFLRPPAPLEKGKSFNKFRTPSSKESWVQVYETASWDEARHIQARLQEEEVECILYEQGKKDIAGNPPRGIGVAVPKTSLNLAQKIISRIPV